MPPGRPAPPRRPRHAEIAKRVGIAATAIFPGMIVDAAGDLGLSSPSPLGSPWDSLQIEAQAWTRVGRHR